MSIRWWLKSFSSPKKLVIGFVIATLFMLALSGTALAADRYWVGDSGLWSDNTTHWASVSGGAPGASLPGTGDNVSFDAASFTVGGQSVTIDAAANCLAMNWTGATDNPTLVFNSSLSAYSDLILIDAMSISSVGGSITCRGGGAGVIDMRGKSIVAPLIVSSSGTRTLASGIALGGGGAFSHTAGTLDTNGYNISCGSFQEAGAVARTLTLGSSTITTASSGGWNYAGSNLVISPNTATIVIAGGGNLVGGNANYDKATFRIVGTSGVVSGSFTTANLTRIGTATKTDTLTLTSGDTITITDNFTVAGNSPTNRVLVQSTVLGTPATINATGWDLAATQNADFMDITTTNAVDLSAITGFSGDCGGNTNITFTVAAAQTWDSTTGNWSDNTKWTSRVPLPQDDVSAGGAGNTITVDMPRIGGSITFTGTPVVTFGNSISNYGSWIDTVVPTTGAFTHYLRCRGGTYVLSTMHNLTITNSSTFSSYNINASSSAKVIKHTDGITVVVADLTRDCLGTANITLQGTALAGWSINKTDSTPISLDYIDVKSSTAFPANVFYAGAHGSDISGNTNWLFTDPALTTTTLAATGITMSRDGVTGGTFNGTITVLAGTPYINSLFNYGLTAGYGTNTTIVPTCSYGAYSANIPVNLVPAQTYHFRSGVFNGAGIASGADAQFTLTMPTVTTSPATNTKMNGGSTATLNGNLTTMGEASDVYSFFQWGYDATYGQTTPQTTQAGTGTYSATITGYDPNETVHYRSAVTVGSVTVYGADSDFTASGGGAIAYNLLWNLLTVAIAAAMLVVALILGAKSGNWLATIVAIVLGAIAIVFVRAALLGMW